MAALIGHIKEVNGDYFVKTPDGSIKKLVLNDHIHEGDTLFGKKGNTLDDAILIAMVVLAKEVLLMGEEEQLFDEALVKVASDESIAQTSPLSVAILSDAIEAYKSTEGSDTHENSSESLPQTPNSSGISTDQFTLHEEYSSDLTAPIADTSKEPLPDTKAIETPESQNIAGIMDVSAAMQSADVTISIIEEPTHKGVHEEVIRAAKESAEADKSSFDVITDKAEMLGDVETGFDTLLVSDAFQIDYEDISSSVRQLQLDEQNSHSIKTLSIDDVLEITPEESHTLRINGDSDDTVGLEHATGEDGMASEWTKAAESVLGDDGNVYDIYTGISGSDTVTLQIDQNITVTDF